MAIEWKKMGATESQFLTGTVGATTVTIDDVDYKQFQIELGFKPTKLLLKNTATYNGTGTASSYIYSYNCLFFYDSDNNIGEVANGHASKMSSSQTRRFNTFSNLNEYISYENGVVTILLRKGTTSSPGPGLDFLANTTYPATFYAYS